MRILIITQAFLESTIPLARSLSQCDNTVEVMVINYEITKKLFVFDFSGLDINNQCIEKEMLSKLISADYNTYLEGIDLRFEFVPYGLQNTFSLIRRLAKIIAYIRKNKYDIIHFIQGSPLALVLASFLPKSKIIFSLHEVTNHSGKTSFKMLSILRFIRHYRFPVIFHSAISQSRFLTFIKDNDYLTNKTQVIKFGLFEMYKLTKSPPIPKELESFKKNDLTVLLFFGRITPDKGLKHLLSAMDSVNQTLNRFHLIIAGAGNIDYDLSSLKNVTVINRYLDNEDIVFLNNFCDVVVCPYLSASQSGIPMTSYVFDKPIIATRVGGFEEFIIHGETGLLIETPEPKYIIDAIKTFENTTSNYYQYLVNNIKDTYASGTYDWKNIAKETANFYKSFL